MFKTEFIYEDYDKKQEAIQEKKIFFHQEMRPWPWPIKRRKKEKQTLLLST